MLLFVGPYSENKRVGGNVTLTMAIQGCRKCVTGGYIFWTTSLTCQVASLSMKLHG